MNFPSIDIQGSILSSDLLVKIRSEQASYQTGKDFNTDFTNAKLKDEISLAWQEAKGQWTIYKSKLTRLKEGEAGTTETRNFWISPLLTNLGYNLTFDRKGEELNGKSFPIGYRDNSLDNFPVYVGGYHESLDKRPENKQLRVSPHAMLQEYLNYSDNDYGIVTNGRQLRLLRDASRITRLSYIEVDLEKMMEEDLYSDFVIFYRVLHASRMLKRWDSNGANIIERYHVEGLEAGSTIRSKLGDALKGNPKEQRKGAIELLANEFLNNPRNQQLRNTYLNGELNTDEYFRQLLRIIYRLLFLFVIEERNLVYADSKTAETKRFNDIYFNHYSLQRLRKLARKLFPPEASRHYDLWLGLISTFSLFEKKEIGEKLGIMALQGDLFGYDAISCPQYDLHNCHLSNAVLLGVIKSLCFFENDNGVLAAVNYGGLDVEEFGSVYEGLLELKLDIKKIEGSELYSCTFISSNERGKSGSHYTPEELVQPLIKHSLEYLIEDRIKPYQQKKATKEATVQSLLSLKIADVACGSGHILLSAARRLALEVARVQSDEEQPNPVAMRKAMKAVVRNCIYGVDKNPLAVELCKIALWLEAYNPGEPLNFLDHHIKCGDAIVGLAQRSELEKGIADEAFKNLPGDDKDIAKAFRDRNAKERKERKDKTTQLKTEYERGTENSVQEAIAEYKTFNQLPESTPDEIERKAKAYKRFLDGKGLSFLKALADTQVAQFFIPKTEDNKECLMTDADFRLILSGYKGWQDRKVAKATTVALEQKVFHWFIEFPEVFINSNSGFDCVLGNPPYMGGLRISTNFGDSYLSYLKSNYTPNSTTTDLVAYFLRRIYTTLSVNGFISIITTNTISQGDTRLASFDVLYSQGATINFAMSSVRWPGVANLNVSIFSIYSGKWILDCSLNGKKVKYISQYISDEVSLSEPKPIFLNKDKVFNGSYYLGDGFVLNETERQEFIRQSKENVEVIFPLLIGNDVNESYNQASSNYIINFFDWSIEKAMEYEGPFLRVKNLVKPFREQNKRAVYREKWWMYGERRVGLYENLGKLNFCFVITATTKYLNLVRQKTDKIFAKSLYVFTIEEFSKFTIVQSSLHDLWARKFSSTLGDTLSYTPSTCFDTFPFPDKLNTEKLKLIDKIGETYHEYRRQLMLSMQLGLTKTYNLFHCNAITKDAVNAKDKQVAALQKHLANTPDTISFEKAIQGILKFRELHMQMDDAVLDAYGWRPTPSLPPGEGVELKHDFYEVDYLPENDRIRFTIHPLARKIILQKLLELNHQIHEEEVKAGLWDKKKTLGKKSATKNSTGDIVEEPGAQYGLDFGDNT